MVVGGKQRVQILTEAVTYRRLFCRRNQVDALPRGTDRIDLVSHHLATLVKTPGRAGECEADEQSKQTIDSAIDHTDANARCLAVFRKLSSAEAATDLDEGQHQYEKQQRAPCRQQRES